MKNYGVTLKTKNGKYSKLVLTIVVEANNKTDAIENAKEMLLGNKYEDVFPKECPLSRLGSTFTKSTFSAFNFNAEKYQ